VFFSSGNRDFLHKQRDTISNNRTYYTENTESRETERDETEKLFAETEKQTN